jgi:hypothetical protein
MTPVTALIILAGLGYVRYCADCDRVLPVTAFEVCTPSVDVSGEPYPYEHRRGTCASCRGRWTRVKPLPMEAELGIVIPIRPAREYRRQAA